MANLAVIPIGWAGAPVVGPGVSVFHSLEADVNATITTLHTFYAALNNTLPSGLQWTFPTAGDIINEVNGQVVGHWSDPGAAPIACIGSGTWTNGVGARVVWHTNGVVNGRSVTGSTFIVPLLVSAYEGAGNITSSVLTTLSGAANSLATGPMPPRIYSRKTLSRAGSSYPVLSSNVPDKVSWLRGRRT